MLSRQLSKPANPEIAPDTRLAISTATWEPKSTASRANPWYNMTNFVAFPPEAHTWGHTFRLTSLPVDLIYHLARLMPKESAVALALANKALYCILGAPFTKGLSTLEHWRLMLLLERDSDLLVVCQQCQKLHGPYDIAPPTGVFSQHVRLTPCVKARQFLLSPGITPGFCRLLARRYIRHQPYADLLTMAVRTRIYTLPDFKFFGTTRLRIIDGSLFIRHERIIAALTSQRDLTGRSAYLLNQLDDHGFGSPLVCPHIRWKSLGLALHCMPHDNQFSMGDGYAAGHQERYGCERNGFHDLDCYDATPVPRAVLDSNFNPALRCALLHHESCQNDVCDSIPAQYKPNLVRACNTCATDMCLGARDVDGIGRVISLTSWKNLGGVNEGQWKSWYRLHEGDSRINPLGRHTRSPPERFKCHRTRGTMVYAAFENIRVPPGAEVPVRWYTPTLSRRVIDLFTGEPKIPDEDWSSHVPGQDFDSY